MEYTNEYVNQLFKQCKTQKEILQKLGKKENGSGWKLVKKLAAQIGLDLKEFNTKLNEEKYLKQPNFCKCCGEELSYKQRNNDYCSHSCAAKINNIGVARNINHNWSYNYTNRNYEKIDNIEIKKCINCGKDLIGEKKKNKFCCRECLTEYHYKEKVKKLLNGENFTRIGGQIPTFIKKYLMEFHNNKCEKCGWGEEHPITHTIPLEVHHIDGDCTNNKLENLQLLCPNCHCLTDNFGSLNKNSKRFHRKKITKTQ